MTSPEILFPLHKSSSQSTLYLFDTMKSDQDGNFTESNSVSEEPHIRFSFLLSSRACTPLREITLLRVWYLNKCLLKSGQFDHVLLYLKVGTLTEDKVVLILIAHKCILL